MPTTAQREFNRNNSAPLTMIIIALATTIATTTELLCHNQTSKIHHAQTYKILRAIDPIITANDATFVNIKGTLKKNVEGKNTVNLRRSRETGQVPLANRTPSRRTRTM
jgi:hypothetical protein